MTQLQILDILLSHCDKEIKDFNRSALFLYRKNIKLVPTKILEVWEKEANLPLPVEICDAPKSGDFKLNKKGVHIKNNLTPWFKIKMTVLAIHYIDGGRREDQIIQNYFMAYLNNGEILSHEIGDLSPYSNLYGHFIELNKGA